METLILVSAISGMLAAVGALFNGWMIAKLSGRLDKLSGRLDRLEGRVDAIEATLQTLMAALIGPARFHPGTNAPAREP